MTSKAVNESPGGLIFDLDGTLLNSLTDLATAGNLVLTRQGWPPHPAAAYKWFIGDGMTKLAERILPLKARRPEVIRQIAQELRQEYRRHCRECTRPYPGIPAMLAALQRQRLPLGVLSNKPEDLTLLLLDHFFPEINFQAIRGGREGEPLKPDPAGALAVAAALEVPPARIMLVGDGANDILTAKRAGMIPVGVLWGFRSEAELRAAGAHYLIAEPSDLMPLILNKFVRTCCETTCGDDRFEKRGKI